MTDYPVVSLQAISQAIWRAKTPSSNFTYGDDMGGLKCPVTSHLRRTNTRDSLAPTGREGSALNNRRRIIRRGLPYGDSSPGVPDSAEHGIVMLVVCASLFRQFEFVQQQWINYGLDAQAGNDTCPARRQPFGRRGDDRPEGQVRHPVRSENDRPPFIVEGIPQFVETARRRLFLRAQHDRLADDRDGRRRPDLTQRAARLDRDFVRADELPVKPNDATRDRRK